MKLLQLLLLSAILSATGAMLNATPLVKNGDRVAITGDSITEQKMYSCYIEAYILACSGLKDVKVFQFGWGGDRAPGFASRMVHDAMFWKPTVATTCYGMNDGNYAPYNEKNTGLPYRKGMNQIVKTFKDGGTTVIIGSPGVVDSNTWRNGNGADVYNETLNQLTKIDAEIAKQQQVAFADLHTLMMAVMTKAKAVNGSQYHVAGGDGVHPGANGHIVMAYAFLKAMGFNGQIANIEMDFKGQTIVSEGHKILKQVPGSVEIESRRYPFCFNGDPKNPTSSASILPFLPFQQDLNRFELKVTNLPTDKAEVSWNDQKKTFTKAELEKGINLAAEFTTNPFTVKFLQLLRELGEKQNHETWMIKGMITNLRPIQDDIKKDPKLRDSVDYLRQKMMQKEEMLDAKAKAIITPVKYQITVTPIK